MGKAQLAAPLSDRDFDKITAFLEMLTGEQPKVTVPILPASGANTKTPER